MIFYGYIPDFRRYVPTNSNITFKLSNLKPFAMFYDIDDDILNQRENQWRRAERKFDIGLEVSIFNNT